jgi:hypothetical protein
MWLPVEGGVRSPDDEYAVLLCVEIRGWLYTLVSAPPDAPPASVGDLAIETSLPSGEALFARSLSGAGADRVDLHVARYFAPPEETAELIVAVTLNAELWGRARLALV